MDPSIYNTAVFSLQQLVQIGPRAPYIQSGVADPLKKCHEALILEGAKRRDCKLTINRPFEFHGCKDGLLVLPGGRELPEYMVIA